MALSAFVLRNPEFLGGFFQELSKPDRGGIRIPGAVPLQKFVQLRYRHRWRHNSERKSLHVTPRQRFGHRRDTGGADYKLGQEVEGQGDHLNPPLATEALEEPFVHRRRPALSESRHDMTQSHVLIEREAVSNPVIAGPDHARVAVVK